MFVYYSLGNRKYWFCSIEKIIEITALLSKKSYYLYDVDTFKGTYNGWFLLDNEYTRKLYEIIEEVSKEIDDETILNDLLALKEVIKGGDVVFG